MKYFSVIWSSLKRKKTRSILTILSILVAFILYGYLSAIRLGFDAGVEISGVDRLVMQHKVSLIQFLPESYEARIEQVQGVDSAVHGTWFGGIYQKPMNFFSQFPVKVEEYLDMYPEYLVSEEHKKAWLETRNGAIAGRKTAERFGWKVGDRIPIQGTIWPRKDGSPTWEFELVGIYDGVDQSTDTTQFFFRYDYFQEARSFGSGNVGWYWIRVDDPDNAAEIAKEVDQLFANSPAETKTQPEAAFMQGFAKQIGDIGFIMTAILVAVFFTILLVAGNSMAQAVRERVQEIAVLKALGFTHGSVLVMVLAESLLLACLGGFAGLAISWTMITTMGDPTNGSLPVFFLPAKDVAIGVLLAILTGLAAGILPAIKAQKLQIADGLRR